MTVHAFTSFTFSYLDRARVLAASLKRHHPDWVLWAVITDRAPEGFAFDLATENFDRLLWGSELYGDETLGWLFKHDIVELCTAVKGRALELILQAGADKVVYLDPDIAVFGALDELTGMLDEASILLTPHQVAPDATDSAVRDNEIASLTYGVFNLGFLAVANDAEGCRFARWWSDRLRDFCYDDVPAGLFTDQKWANLIPAFFENIRIIRDPGYNVASWNLSNQRIAIHDDGSITVNGLPLRFYHFTKLGPIGDIMTERYARDNLAVYEIWSWYRRAVLAARDASIPHDWWHYGRYDSGQPIKRHDRLLYRNRLDLRRAFPNPFAGGEYSYLGWLAANG